MIKRILMAIKTLDRTVFKTIGTALSLTVVLSGCSTKSTDITANYVSPQQYRNLSCNRIIEERNGVTSELNAFVSQQDKKAQTDAASVAVGVIFWPALIGLAAGTDQEGRIAQLKGEYDALTIVGTEKNCFK